MKSALRHVCPVIYSATLIMAALATGACETRYGQGDCEPGYLQVNGECILAVGTECTSSGGCLSKICLTGQDGTKFCSISCTTHEACPTGFYCTTWADKRCYPGQRPPPCQSDDDCLACETCEQGQCLPQADCQLCEDDEDCSAGCQRCHLGQCIEVAGCLPCTGDEECPTCESCAPQGSCERVSGCVYCSSDQECPGCMHCDRGACMVIEGCGSEPCFNDTTCPQKTRCLLDSILGFNVCLPVALDFGADCSRGGDATCRDGICLLDESTLAEWCSLPCTDLEDCPQGYQCSPDEDCLWACRLPHTPPPGQTCSADRDCPQDRLCGLVASSAGEEYQQRCVAPLVCAPENGQPCAGADDLRCQSGICAPTGLCTPICAADLDCPSGFLCSPMEVFLPGLENAASFRGCVPYDLAQAELGEPCPDGDGDCRSGYCLDGGASDAQPLCSQACNPDAPACPDRYSCLAAPPSSPPDTFACQPALAQGSCIRDWDCARFEVCQPSLQNGLGTCAVTQAQSLASGALCYNHGQCAHGLCLAEGRCAELCLDSDDCINGQECVVREWVRPDGGRLWMRLCTLAPGSVRPCRSLASCEAGEVCRPELNPWAGGVDGRCREPGGSGLPFEPCQFAADCGRGFCPEEGYCSLLCEDDSHCPDGSHCGLLSLTVWDSTSYPLAACLMPPGELGQACPNGAQECTSDMCHEPSQGEPYCTQSCLADEDCSAVSDMICINQGQGGTCQFGEP